MSFFLSWLFLTHPLSLTPHSSLLVSPLSTNSFLLVAPLSISLYLSIYLSIYPHIYISIYLSPLIFLFWSLSFYPPSLFLCSHPTYSFSSLLVIFLLSVLAFSSLFSLPPTLYTLFSTSSYSALFMSFSLLPTSSSSPLSLSLLYFFVLVCLFLPLI